ncbi:PepSY domain-containing protein [Elioraea sp. Yellowstone]|uniref:PepSY domain-containing protein n=1 Tax=Elioraea sp. Yellowstone TaxID=2592070 RepID=UPI0013868FF7|nr:PepSY domain-containing protein [Elioraea sp. Yellowstone]
MMRWSVMAAPAAMAAAILGTASPVVADDRCDRAEVRAERAIAIAREAGVALVEDLECDDGRWDIEGRSANGREIEIRIDPRTGRVLRVERDD